MQDLLDQLGVDERSYKQFEAWHTRSRVASVGGWQLDGHESDHRSVVDMDNWHGLAYLNMLRWEEALV